MDKSLAVAFGIIAIGLIVATTVVYADRLGTAQRNNSDFYEMSEEQCEAMMESMHGTNHHESMMGNSHHNATSPDNGNGPNEGMMRGGGCH